MLLDESKFWLVTIHYVFSPLNILELFSSATQQPNLGPGRLIVEVSRSHTITLTQPVRLL